MDSLQQQLHLLEKERNVYEPANLFVQRRRDINQILPYLAAPGTDHPLKIENGKLIDQLAGNEFEIREGLVDFRKIVSPESTWEHLNRQFLNYDRSLTIYTMLNALPLLNYLRIRSGLGDLKNARVLDAGGGNGHTLCSFFQYSDTLEYFLLDPNERLLHDQFIRIYPELQELPIAHLLAFAEAIPLRSGSMDVVLSMSAIDHYQDEHQFFRESYRILKTGGILFITSHLHSPSKQRVQHISTAKKIFSTSLWERITRYVYYRRYHVKRDDHVRHFTSIEPIRDGLEQVGFQILDSEEFLGHFWIKATK